MDRHPPTSATARSSVSAARSRTSGPVPGPPPDAWASGDPLGETLHALRMTGIVYTRSHLTAPWGVDLPPMPECVMFHVVTSGRCRLEVAGEEPRTLQPGDFALMPHGQGHVIRDDPASPARPLFDLPIEHVCERYEILRHGGGGEATTLVCGAVQLSHPAARDLLDLLPALIHVRTWSTPHAEWMHSTLRLMAAEATGRQPGGETIVTRLADILVIQAIRTWLLEHPEGRTGWLGALDDERIGPAIAAIHRQPTHDWTVETLAARASMSRSAFSARFTDLVGESPGQYLTRWRMHLAGGWIRDDGLTPAECAVRLGYRSEAAFRRAFKRVLGVAPGAWRRAVSNAAQLPGPSGPPGLSGPSTESAPASPAVS